jgi:hypothetical protein
MNLSLLIRTLSSQLPLPSLPTCLPRITPGVMSSQKSNETPTHTPPTDSEKVSKEGTPDSPNVPAKGTHHHSPPYPRTLRRHDNIPLYAACCWISAYYIVPLFWDRLFSANEAGEVLLRNGDSACIASFWGNYAICVIGAGMKWVIQQTWNMGVRCWIRRRRSVAPVDP